MSCTLHVIYSMAKNGTWLNMALVSSIIIMYNMYISHYECYITFIFTEPEGRAIRTCNVILQECA